MTHKVPGWPSASVCQRHAGSPRAQLLAAGFGGSRQSVVPRHRHPRCPRVVGEERQPPSASSCLVAALAAPRDAPEEVRQVEPSLNWTVCNTLPLSLAHRTHRLSGSQSEAWRHGLRDDQPIWHMPQRRSPGRCAWPPRGRRAAFTSQLWRRRARDIAAVAAGA